MTTGTDAENGVSRRALLKRGAVAGAAVWVVPVVTFVSATPAHAASASAPSGGGTGGQGTVGHGIDRVDTTGGGSGSITAETGPAIPLKPTIIAASAAVAAGAGAVAIAQIGKRRAAPAGAGAGDDVDPEADPS